MEKLVPITRLGKFFGGEDFDLEVNIDVVDIGASPSGGAPPYQSLIDNNCASVVGFEPDQERLRSGAG